MDTMELGTDAYQRVASPLHEQISTGLELSAAGERLCPWMPLTRLLKTALLTPLRIVFLCAGVDGL